MGVNATNTHKHTHKHTHHGLAIGLAFIATPTRKKNAGGVSLESNPVLARVMAIETRDHPDEQSKQLASRKKRKNESSFREAEAKKNAPDKAKKKKNTEDQDCNIKAAVRAKVLGSHRS